jgi:hypothetical protein
MRFIFKGYLLRWLFLLLLAGYRSLALMVQISNEIFRHESWEKGVLFSLILLVAYRLPNLTKTRG